MRSDIVVVGAGATGLAMTALLGALDVAVLLLEKRPRLPVHPQAHFLNHRTMEICRPLSGVTEEITRAGPPLNEWRKFVYAEKLSGGVYGQVDHFVGQSSQLTRFSPEPIAHFSQNKLLPLLLDHVRRGTSVQVKFGTDVLECTSSKSGVHVRYGYRSVVQEVQAKFAVVANGANSDLVQQLGIPFQGECLSNLMKGTKEIQNLLSVHFYSKQLSEMLKANPAMLYFIFNHEVVLVLVVHDLKSGEFVAQIPFFPPVQHPSDFQTDNCARLVCAAAGCHIKDIQVTQMNIDEWRGSVIQVASVRPWIMKTQVADTYQSGNVFLAGDAAHVFPPAGGFGMNTGIQDAHNLAWKLASVIRGSRSESLLSTYTSERRPIAIQNSRLSLENWKEATLIPAALGLDPSYARRLQEATAAVDGFLPRFMSKAFLEGSLSFGRHLSGLRGPLKAWRQQQLNAIFQSRRTLRLQFLKEDLGFSYSKSDGNTEAACMDRSKKTEFIPEVVVHGRLPHTVVQLTPSKRSISSLDFVSWSGLNSTVFLIQNGATFLMDSLKFLTKEDDVEIINVISLQLLSAHDQTGKSKDLEYIPFTRFEDLSCEEYEQLDGGICLFEGLDVDGTLIHGMQSVDASAIMVRPDGHIASVHNPLTAT